MASYNELNALIDAYINRNGVQAITGQILNGVLKAMVEQLGRGYTIMGAAIPTTDPGTPDGPECYFASETGTYTDFDGLQVAPGELALLCYTPSDGWTKATIYEGFREVGATIDGNVGTPSVGVSYANGVLSFDFHNMKGNPGQNGQDGAAAGFGSIGADITGGVGTPGVTVESSGPATEKNLQFHFANLKGETGVTSVVATVDNTTGTPACTVSLVGQQLTLAFSGLKGAQGDTGSSVDYPFTIVNNLTTDDATQALSAAQGVVLDGKVTQLEAKVTDIEFNLEEYSQRIQMASGYIVCNGAVGTVVNLTPVSHATYHYAIVPCQSGDVFYIQGKGGNSDRLFCFVDASNKVITSAPALTEYSVPTRIVAPNNSSKVIINDEATGRISYNGEKTTEIIRGELDGKIDKDGLAVAPKDIKNAPYFEDFRCCEIIQGKCPGDTSSGNIVWSYDANWYTIAIYIKNFINLVLVSDVVPQSVINWFLTVGIDSGNDTYEYVGMANSRDGFSLSPNAYTNDGEKMTLILKELLSTYSYLGNIILFIKMPNTYKINWLASGMQLEGYDWMKIGSYAKAELKKELRSDNVRIVMPSTIYTVVGHEMNIYFDGVVQCDDIDRYDVYFGMGSMTTVCKLQNERLRIFPNSANNGVAFTMKVLDKMNHDVIASKSFTVKANADTKFEKKVIFIGDSLTDRCIYPVEICQELGNNKLVSLGTRFDSLSYEGSDGVVTATNFANEGRSGWNAKTYTNLASSGGVVNAFWNPSANEGNGGFDFTYYMGQNNFDSVDCVAIVLGPNDIASIITGGSTVEEIVSCFREMVDSIHSYNSGIKVIVSLPPHSAEPDGFGQDCSAYNVCQKEFVERLIAEFDGNTNIYLAPVFANIDYHNDYPYDDVPISARNPKIVSRQNNNVHFSKDSTNPVSQCWGYLKMADAIWYTMVAAFGEN